MQATNMTGKNAERPGLSRPSSSSTTQPPSPRLYALDKISPIEPALQDQKEISKVIHTTDFNLIVNSDGQETETESQPSSPIPRFAHSLLKLQTTPPSRLALFNVDIEGQKALGVNMGNHEGGTLKISKIQTVPPNNLDNICDKAASSKTVRDTTNSRVPNYRAIARSPSYVVTDHKDIELLKTSQTYRDDGEKLENSSLQAEGNRSPFSTPLIRTTLQQRHCKDQHARNITINPSAQPCPPLKATDAKQTQDMENPPSLPPLPRDRNINKNTNLNHVKSKANCTLSNLRENTFKKPIKNLDQKHGKRGYESQNDKSSQPKLTTASKVMRKPCTKPKAQSTRPGFSGNKKSNKSKLLKLPANTGSIGFNNASQSPKNTLLPSNCTTKNNDQIVHCRLRNYEKEGNAMEGKKGSTLSETNCEHRISIKSVMKNVTNKSKSPATIPTTKRKSNAKRKADRKGLKALKDLPSDELDSERIEESNDSPKLLCTGAQQASITIDTEQQSMNESKLESGETRSKTIQQGVTNLKESGQQSVDPVLETEVPKNGSEDDKKTNVVAKHRRRRSTQESDGLNAKSCRRKICQQIELQRDYLMKDCIMQLIDQSSSIVNQNSDLGIQDLKIPRVIQGIRALTVVRMVGVPGVDKLDGSMSKEMTDWSDKWLESCAKEGMEMIRRQMWMFKEPHEDAIKFVTSIFQEIAIWLLDYTSKKHALAEQVTNGLITELGRIGQDVIAGRLDEKWTDVICDHFLSKLSDWFGNHRDHDADKVWQLVDNLLEQASKLGRESHPGMSSGAKMVQVGRRQILTTSLIYLRCRRYSAQDPTIRPLRIRHGHVDPLSLRFALLCGATAQTNK